MALSFSLPRREVAAWALYDWANSAFATTVVAGLFPAFYGSFWDPGDAAHSTAHLGLGNTIASISVAIMAPMLGAIADRGGARKKFLLAFTLLGVAMSAALFFVGQGQWFQAMTVFVIGNIGFNGACSFYDSMLVDVAEPEKFDSISALGFSVGYLGGGLLFALNVVMVKKPELFGIPDVPTAIRLSFVTVAVWWAVFTIPYIFLVKERSGPNPLPLRQAAVAGLKQFAETFHELRRLKPALMFIIAYVLYIDGVNTVIRMAVKFGSDLKFPTGVLIGALLVTQFVAFPAALAFGKIGERIGAKRGILAALAVYGGITIFGSMMTKPSHFYMLAVMVGLVQGGVQSLSRSFFARLIPTDKAGEFFGFYNMLGKAAAIIGPTLMAVVGLLSPNPRYSILSLLVLFIAGAAVLRIVPEPETPAA